MVTISNANVLNKFFSIILIINNIINLKFIGKTIRKEKNQIRKNKKMGK